MWVGLLLRSGMTSSWLSVDMGCTPWFCLPGSGLVVFFLFV